MMKNFDNKYVRRQDRLLDAQSSETLLKRAEYGVLSMIEGSDNTISGYGIPISYVWDGDKYIYIHCAPEGHKLECLDINPNVSLCIIGRTNVISQKFTTEYESVLIRGEITRNLTEQERMSALELILDKYSPNDKEVGMKYAQKSFHRTEILRLEVCCITAKSKQL